MRGSVCGSLRSLRRDKRGDGERGGPVRSCRRDLKSKKEKTDWRSRLGGTMREQKSVRFLVKMVVI